MWMAVKTRKMNCYIMTKIWKKSLVCSKLCYHDPYTNSGYIQLINPYLRTFASVRGKPLFVLMTSNLGRIFSSTAFDAKNITESLFCLLQMVPSTSVILKIRLKRHSRSSMNSSLPSLWLCFLTHANYKTDGYSVPTFCVQWSTFLRNSLISVRVL